MLTAELLKVTEVELRVKIWREVVAAFRQPDGQNVSGLTNQYHPASGKYLHLCESTLLKNGSLGFLDTASSEVKPKLRGGRVSSSCTKFLMQLNSHRYAFVSVFFR